MQVLIRVIGIGGSSFLIVTHFRQFCIASIVCAILCGAATAIIEELYITFKGKKVKRQND